MITKCARNYYKYPASMKPNLNSKDLVRFPKGCNLLVKYSVTVFSNDLYEWNAQYTKNQRTIPWILTDYSGAVYWFLQ